MTRCRKKIQIQTFVSKRQIYYHVNLIKSQKHTVKLTTEKGVFITVVSTVIVTIAQVSRVDADVGVITFDEAISASPVSCSKILKQKGKKSR